MNWLGYVMIILGALSFSCSVMRWMDKLEHPKAKRKTPTMGQHRQGRVSG